MNGWVCYLLLFFCRGVHCCWKIIKRDTVLIAVEVGDPTMIYVYFRGWKKTFSLSFWDDLFSRAILLLFRWSTCVIEIPMVDWLYSNGWLVPRKVDKNIWVGPDAAVNSPKYLAFGVLDKRTNLVTHYIFIYFASGLIFRAFNKESGCLHLHPKWKYRTYHTISELSGSVLCCVFLALRLHLFDIRVLGWLIVCFVDLEPQVFCQCCFSLQKHAETRNKIHEDTTLVKAEGEVWVLAIF